MQSPLYAYDLKLPIFSDVMACKIKNRQKSRIIIYE